jgi:hypothetical protein
MTKPHHHLWGPTLSIADAKAATLRRAAIKGAPTLDDSHHNALFQLIENGLCEVRECRCGEVTFRVTSLGTSLARYLKDRE